MENSKIDWTDNTFNAWEGCTKVSPGCANCYAEARNQRFASGTNWGKGKPRRRTSEANWRLPLEWNDKRRWEERDAEGCGRDPGPRPRVFCASLADVFDEEVPDAWRDDLFELVAKCTNLDWQILTKRPEKMRDYLLGESGAGAANFEEGGCFRHVWLGVSVENQKAADERVPVLLSIPAAVLFLSCEPMLGHVDIARFTSGAGIRADRSTYRIPGIDWVICGGESGPNARPMHPEWARSLRDQCEAAGVAFFFKQWGEWTPGENVMSDRKLACAWYDEDNRWSFSTQTQKQAEEGHRDDQPDVYRIGKKAAGRMLDGEIHNAFPEVE